MQTAVTYARFSSDRQHESSIEAQQDAMRKWAAGHDTQIVEEYADRGISGTTDERPAFQEMIRSLKQRRVDFVLVHKYDRFARNKYDSAIYGHQIEKNGARLIAVAQDFGTSPEAIIMESLMQAWAEYYSKNLATETLKGMKVMAHKGYYLSGWIPFGYRAGSDRSQLVIDEEEAQWVRQLFEAHRQGRGIKHVCDQMAAAGVRGRRGKPITPRSVAVILRNIVYTGVYERTYGSETIRIEDHHPAIISKALFEEVNKNMDARTFAGRSPETRRYLCSGIARCGYCNAPLTGHVTRINGVEYPSYFCRSCAKHPKPRLRSIRIEELDRIAIRYVQQLLTPEVQKEAAEALSKYISGRTQDTKRREPAVRKTISEMQNKIDAIVQNISSGVLPPSVLKSLGDQVTQLEEAIQAQQKLLEQPPADVEGIAEFFKAQASIDETTPFEIAQPIIEQYIQSITLTNEKIEIRSSFADWLKKHHPEFEKFISADNCTLVFLVL
ncbi:MAG: recombinase family protein [Clostridia bacterium]|nr:recombinase family protein [Clostridia bacterium]